MLAPLSLISDNFSNWYFILRDMGDYSFLYFLFLFFVFVSANHKNNWKQIIIIIVSHWVGNNIISLSCKYDFISSLLLKGTNITFHAKAWIPLIDWYFAVSISVTICYKSTAAFFRVNSLLGYFQETMKLSNL